MATIDDALFQSPVCKGSCKLSNYLSPLPNTSPITYKISSNWKLCVFRWPYTWDYRYIAVDYSTISKTIWKKKSKRLFTLCSHKNCPYLTGELWGAFVLSSLYKRYREISRMHSIYLTVYCDMSFSFDRKSSNQRKRIPKHQHSLQWRHNERDGVSNHRRLYYLLNRLFRHRSKKPSKLRVTGLCERNPPVTGGFPSQKPSNAENYFIWWRHLAKELWRNHIQLCIRYCGYHWRSTDAIPYL